MKTDKRNKSMKGFVLTSSLVLLTLLSACSDSKEGISQKDTQKQEQSTTNGNNPKIEIVQNNDAHAVKVAQQEAAKMRNNSFYYDYGKKNTPTAQEKYQRRTDIDANMNIRSPYEKVEVSMLVKKLSKNFIVRCAPCHNDYANGIIGPSLLGRNANYIYGRIQDFKTGKKSNPLMNDLIKMMNDEQIRTMANEIYAFNKEIQKMRNR